MNRAGCILIALASMLVGSCDSPTGSPEVQIVMEAERALYFAPSGGFSQHVLIDMRIENTGESEVRIYGCDQSLTRKANTASGMVAVFAGACNITSGTGPTLEVGADTVVTMSFPIQGAEIDLGVQYSVALSFKLPPDFKRGTTIRSNYFTFKPEN